MWSGRTIRAAYWVAAVVLGAAQTWYMRHRIFSDGISYLAIAQAYLRGDWHSALNGYWSPLYSWLIAIYLAIFQPSPYWQVSSLHVINFAAFLAACWTFERFLTALLRNNSNSRQSCLQESTILAAGLVTVLFGGFVDIGIGYVSPDLIAYAITGLLAWLTVLIQQGQTSAWVFIAFGGALGLGYLDRSAFAPLAVFYVAAVGGILWRMRRGLIRPLAWIGVAGILISAPFPIALSRDRGRLTLGDSGKLNYGWEVAGAARSTHWQGEPGDIGKPLHPTRKILSSPVPVFEFSEPVSGPYPPWYDPSYWYEGIQPHLKIGSQISRTVSNLIMTAIVAGACPAVPIVFLLLVAGRGDFRRLRDSLTRNWGVILPPLVAIAIYCLVFVDRRYIAGFIAVFWLSVLCALNATREPRWRHTELAARGLCLLVFAGVLLPLMSASVSLALGDLVHLRERQANFNSLLAERFRKIGLRPGDKIAYSGISMNADWVRLAGCKIVAEVPITYDREQGWKNFVIANKQYQTAFAELDDKDRETVLDAFRRAGAVIAVVDGLPKGANQTGWTRAIDADEPRLPWKDGQYPDGFETSYRWLNVNQ
jgi:hypothetical protein